MDDRVELKIDVFDFPGQTAKVLKSLTVRELIEETLLEFEELPFLDSNAPWNYDLRPPDEGPPYSPEKTIAEHRLTRGTELVLVERPVILPPGATAMPGHVYLIYVRKSDTDIRRVFKLAWQPAIIGRPDTLQPMNDLLAVNLESFPTGLRVSRRHAKIYESGGRYFLESMSNNPIFINDDTDPLSGARELTNGDQIHLERSDITLQFIERPE